MSERCELMKKLSAAHFAVVELQLFLDTHPNCSEAFEKFKKEYDEYKRLLKEYEMKFGCITPKPQFGQVKYQWINDPWPWERECD